MRLARLRHQLLIAMGVPACWTQQAPEPTTPPPRPPAETAFDRAACPRDSIPETVCGAREEDLGRCGPHGDSLASYDELKLYVTRDDGDKRTYRRFSLDAAATADYRQALASDGIAVNEHCCYSRCTPLSVGRLDAISPDRYMVSDTRCFPHPPRGTSVPSDEDPACPAAVRFDGTLRPYTSSEEEKTCCYSVPGRRIRPVRGRPARVDGAPRFAQVGPGAAWRLPELRPDREREARRSGLPAREARGPAPVHALQPEREFHRAAPAAEAAPPERDAHRVASTPEAAPPARDAHWAALAPQILRPEVDALPRALRERLAAAWLDAAREEHASIASFANLSLRLLALGAPPDLVADAHVAALDEIRHAQLSFELASAYAGTPLAPVCFGAAARMSAAGDLASLAIETLLDGCINETVAAALAGFASESASDPAVAAVLRDVADDEARHAELAWRIVAWSVRSSGPDLLGALHETLAAAAAAPIAASPDARDDLAAHGVLGDAAHAATRAAVLREIVAPCLAALAA